MTPNKIIARFYFKHAEICDCGECKNKRQKKGAPKNPTPLEIDPQYRIEVKGR